MEKNKLVGHGFVAPSEILPEEHIFGGQIETMPIMQDDGNWEDYLPEEEPQARLHFDTYGCTVYGTLNAIEILEKRVLGEDNDYAERYVYIGTGTRPPGNNPHVISEWIRKNGLINERMLPYTDLLQGLDDYTSPNPLTVQYTEEGKRWLTKNSFNHEWTYNGGTIKEKHERIKEALRRCPLNVSVCAWKERDGIFYKDEGDIDNHWTTIFGYDNGYPLIFDTYKPYIKKLDKDYDFGFSKRYFLKRNPAIIPVKKSFFSFSFIQKWLPKPEPFVCPSA